MIFRTLLARLSFRRTAGRLSRVVMCLAHSPAVALVTIIRLLLFGLPLAGIDEQLFFRCWCLNDFALRRLNNHIAARSLSVVDFVGIVVRYTAYPERRVIQRQKGNYKTERRRDDNEARTVWTVPDSSIEIVSRVAKDHHMVTPRHCTDEM